MWTREEIREAKKISQLPSEDWTPTQQTSAQQLIEHNIHGLETLHKAVEMPLGSFNLDYSDFFDPEIPDLLGLLKASYLLNLEARQTFASGDTEGGFLALETLARMTQSLRDEPILIFSLIAHATERLFLHAVVEALMVDEIWAASPQMFDRLERLIPSFDVLAASQHLVALDSVIVALITLEGRREPWTQETFPFYAYYFGHSQAAEYLDFGQEIADLTYIPFGTSREDSSPWRGDLQSLKLASDYRDATAKSQLQAGQRDLVTAAMAMRRLGIERGGYPSTCPPLEVLTSNNPFTGTPLHCASRDDGTLFLAMPEADKLTQEIFLYPAPWILQIELPAIVALAPAD